MFKVAYLGQAHWPGWCPRGKDLAQLRLQSRRQTWLRWESSRCVRGLAGVTSQNQAGAQRAAGNRSRAAEASTLRYVAALFGSK